MQVPATLTPAQPLALVAAVEAAYLEQLGHPPQLCALALLCAQLALETANGAKIVANNPGNFKAGEGPDWCDFKTFEFIGTPPVKTVMACRFSAWPSLADGTSAWLRALYLRWPEAWSAAVRGDALGFAHGLKLRGYYTAPEADYAHGLAVWRDRYVDLLAGGPLPAARADEAFPAPVGTEWEWVEPEVLPCAT